MDINDLVRSSGDSILEHYQYSDGILTIRLYADELDRKIEIFLKTNALLFEPSYFEKSEEAFRTCRIEIIDIQSVLSSQNGLYIPSNTFEKFMGETKAGYNLAYGKKTSEVKFIFSLVGHGRLITCLLYDFHQIEIKTL
jgi:hypothetical protein